MDNRDVMAYARGVNDLHDQVEQIGKAETFLGARSAYRRLCRELKRLRSHLAESRDATEERLETLTAQLEASKGAELGLIRRLLGAKSAVARTPEETIRDVERATRDLLVYGAVERIVGTVAQEGSSGYGAARNAAISRLVKETKPRITYLAAGAALAAVISWTAGYNAGIDQVQLREESRGAVARSFTPEEGLETRVVTLERVMHRGQEAEKRDVTASRETATGSGDAMTANGTTAANSDASRGARALRGTMSGERAPKDAKTLGTASIPEEALRLLEGRPFTEGERYLVIDKGTQRSYAGQFRFVVEHTYPVSTGINPGQRTTQEQGTTPEGFYKIIDVRRTEGVPSRAGVKGAFGPYAAVIDDEEGTLRKLFGSESKIWGHGQPEYQDRFLGKARISAGCPHFRNEDLLVLRRAGYFQKGVGILIYGGEEWDGIPEQERRGVYERVYAAVVSQEPGRRPNSDVLRFGPGPEGINALTAHLVDAYRGAAQYALNEQKSEEKSEQKSEQKSEEKSEQKSEEKSVKMTEGSLIMAEGGLTPKRGER